MLLIFFLLSTHYLLIIFYSKGKFKERWKKITISTSALKLIKYFVTDPKSDANTCFSNFSSIHDTMKIDARK